MRNLITVILFLVSFHTFSQDSLRLKRIEVAGALYKFNGTTLHAHLSFGFSSPARKANWYNTLRYSMKSNDYLLDLNTTAVNAVVVGKAYEFGRKHFFGVVGLEAGLFYLNVVYWDSKIRLGGICVQPRLEMGYHFKKSSLNLGLYFIEGAGYCKEKIFYEDEDPIFPKIPREGFGRAQVGAPYLKWVWAI